MNIPRLWAIRLAIDLLVERGELTKDRMRELLDEGADACGDDEELRTFIRDSRAALSSAPPPNS